jgi:hypothetical protein
VRYKTVVIVDHDQRIDKWGWAPAYEKAVTAGLQALGFKVTDVIGPTPSSSGRGVKYWFHIESPRRIGDSELNMLNFIAGDDRVRVRINRLRIRRGLRNFWNKCFSEARLVTQSRCMNCKIVKTLKAMEEEECSTQQS